MSLDTFARYALADAGVALLAVYVEDAPGVALALFSLPTRGVSVMPCAPGAAVSRTFSQEPGRELRFGVGISGRCSPAMLAAVAVRLREALDEDDVPGRSNGGC